MPDEYGFDHLGENVRCIEPDCGAGGPVGEWPTSTRLRHYESHEQHASGPARASRSNRASTGDRAMSKRKTPSGREACIAVLAAAEKPLTANEIASTVVESGIAPTVNGKTPKATLSAQITSGAKKGETFKKVGAGRPQKFALRPNVEPNQELVATLRERAAQAAAQSGSNGKAEAKPDPKAGSKDRATAAA